MAALRDVEDDVAALEGRRLDVGEPGLALVLFTAFRREDAGAEDPLAGIEGAVREGVHDVGEVVELVPNAADVDLRAEGGDELRGHGVMAVMVDLGDVGRAADVGDGFLRVEDGAVGEPPAVGEVAGGVEAEGAVGEDHAEAHAVFVEALGRVLLAVGVEVDDAAVGGGDAAVAAEVEDGEVGIAGTVVPEGDLVGLADAELLDLHAAVFPHVVVEFGHVGAHQGAVVEQRDRVEEFRIAAVEGAVEIQEFGGLAEAGEVVVLAVALHFVGEEGFAAAVVIVVVGEHHVVDVAAGGVDPLDVAGDPLAGVPAAVRQHRHGELAPPDGVVVAAVQQHARPVREDHEHGFGDAGVDEMDLEMAFLPAFPGFADLGIDLAGGKGLFPIQQQGRRGRRRNLDELSSFHISGFYFISYTDARSQAPKSAGSGWRSCSSTESVSPMPTRISWPRLLVTSRGSRRIRMRQSIRPNR